MTTLVQKIRLSGSVSRSFRGTFLGALIPGFVVLALSACSHAPVRDSGSLGSVRFVVEAPGSAEVDMVLLRGRTAQPAMSRIQAQPLPGDLWTVEVDLLPGEYRYFFLVDGSVTVNGGRPRVEKDDFGGVTGVLRVFRDSNGEIQAY